MKNINIHSSFKLLFRTQLLLLALILLPFCAEHKKKERVPIDEKVKKQDKKREKLTLHEADASGATSEEGVFSLDEKIEKQPTQYKTDFDKNQTVVLVETKEDVKSPVITVDMVIDNAVQVKVDSLPSRVSETTAVDSNDMALNNDFRTLKNSNPLLDDKNKKDTNSGVTVHLTDIDLAKERDDIRSAENKKMFVQLETRVLFDGGSFELSSKYKSRLDDLIRQIEDEIQTYRSMNKEEVLVLLIQVKGYSDTKAFYENQNVSERQKMNQELSDKRAKAVIKYIEKGVNQPNLEIEEVVTGLGEELPLGVYDNGEEEDQNRRACSIYLLICSQK